MMPEEDEEMIPGGGGGGVGNDDGQPAEHQHAAKQGSSRNAVERNYSSSSNRDRDGGRYDDDYHPRSNRDHRDRERSHRDRDHRDRHRDRDHRDRDHGGRHRDHHRDHRDDYRDRRDKRSRSRSKESRSRDRDRDRHRSQRDDRASRDAPRTERTVQDRLSAEIEQELANLRRQHDMKEALKKQQQQQEEDKEKASNNEDDSQEDGSKPTGSGSRTITGTHYGGHLRKQNTSSFLPKNDSGQPVEYVPEIQTEEERIEFQRKMQEKLQQHLAAEGKLYPPPAKPQRDVPTPMVMTGFANDGSFLEMFKKLQQQATTSSNAAMVPTMLPTVATIPPGVKPMMIPTALPRMPLVAQKAGPFKLGPTMSTPAVSQVVKPTPIDKEPPPPVLPVFGRRRGGKILKTGMVKKVRPVEESTADAPNDAWTLYLQEVKKYKSASCDADSKTRPLVK